MSEVGLRKRIVVDVEPAAEREDGDYRAFVEGLRTLARDGYTEILLDVGGVPNADSMLLGAIAWAWTSALRYGTTIRLLHPNAQLRNLLSVTKLDRLLETTDTENGDV
jgi:anti-anti-sigma regulatory factor